MADFLQPREASLAEALGEMQVAVNEQRERAEKAEAAIERVRLEIPNWGTRRSRDALLRALDGSETP